MIAAEARLAIAEGAPPDERFRRWFYLGGLASLVAGIFAVNARTTALIVRAAMSEAEFEGSLQHYPYGRWFRSAYAPERRRALWLSYIAPVVRFAGDAAIGDRPLLVRAGDDVRPAQIPTFGRARMIDAGGMTALMPLQHDRHFGMIGMVDSADVPFRDKARRLVWRGATTGVFRITPLEPRLGVRAAIPAVMARVSDPAIDIGYSLNNLRQERCGVPLGGIDACIRPALTPEQQLSARYLLSLEGNDTASGLKWMLYSNSVVIMPHPTVETWACEPQLKPMVHYVPVRPDLSDLEDVFAWCLCNDAACERIAHNGRAFVEGLRDPKTTRQIAIAIIRHYAAKVTLVAEGADITAGFLDVRHAA